MQELGTYAVVTTTYDHEVEVYGGFATDTEAMAYGSHLADADLHSDQAYASLEVVREVTA